MSLHSLQDLVLLRDQMNRLFENATHWAASEPDSPNGIERPEWYPAADVYEDDQQYTVAVDLPGIERATLEISLNDDKLAITGLRLVKSLPAHRAERPRGRFLRTFSVPTSVDQENIGAEFKDGVLQVHLPKRSEDEAQRVEIKVS